MTETPPRDCIVGSRLTDFMHFGYAYPWRDKTDFAYCVCMMFILAISFIKLGLMVKGHLFITLHDTLP